MDKTRFNDLSPITRPIDGKASLEEYIGEIEEELAKIQAHQESLQRTLASARKVLANMRGQ